MNEYHEAMLKIAPKMTQQASWAAIRLTRTKEVDTQARDKIIDEIMELLYKTYRLGFAAGLEGFEEDSIGE